MVTLEEAERILGERRNGTLEGTSPSKGGRAWLDGEWCLDELEALCIVIRHEAGEYAQGAEEQIAIWRELDADQQ